ncbi:MAG: hypothetical protein U0736_17490 [Gemmataceae bacterium]
MTANKIDDVNVSQELLEAIAAFPVRRQVQHCGTTFQVSPFDIYAPCPYCKTRIKVRSFGGPAELEDVFDAVLSWMLQPGAEEAVRRRQVELTADDD